MAMDTWQDGGASGGAREDAPAILRVRELTKDFGGVHAVDHCSFDVRRGTISGLIGPNGAGKTTLFNLVTGFVKPTSGAIAFMDRRIEGLPPHRIFGAGLVRTFQIPREFKRMSVLENLMLVPGGQTGERLWASWLMPWRVAAQERAVERQALDTLEFLNLIHLRNEYAANLSGGQKKLLELGRMLMAKPEMILLDEPGAGVNPTLMNALVEDILLWLSERMSTTLVAYVLHCFYLYTFSEIWGGEHMGHLQFKPGVLVLIPSNCCSSCTLFHLSIIHLPVSNEAYTLN